MDDGPRPDGSEQPTDVSRRPVAVKIVVRTVLGVIVIWAAAVVVSALLGRAHLVAAESALSSGRDAVADQDLDAARSELATAEDRASRARRQLLAPHVRLVAAVPLLGDSLRVAGDVAAGASEVSDATLDLVATVDGLPDGLESLEPRDGRLPVHELGELAAPLTELAGALRTAVDRLEAAPGSWVIGPVDAARTRFLGLATPLADQMETAATLTVHLPRFLGSEGPRRHLLLASNPAELRGSGGFLGSYAVMRVRGGELDIGSFSATMDLPTLPEGEIGAPAGWFGDRYGRFGAERFLPNSNMTPDFPTAAAAILTLWETIHGERLDGIVVVDPFVLEALLEVTGPVEADDLVVDADGVVDYVTNEAYAEFEGRDERQEVLGDVAAIALEAFLDTPDLDDWRDAIDPLGRAARGGHLLLYSPDATTQEAFVTAGLDGGLPERTGDVVSVVVNSRSASKLDYYLERSVDYRVRLLSGGAVSGELRVDFRNTAPTEGMPSYVIGPNIGALEAGENRSLVSVNCAPGCAFTRRPQPAVTFGGDHDGGYPAADVRFDLASGATRTLEAAWRLDDGWVPDDGELVYRLTYLDQTTIAPTDVRVRVAIPDDLEPAGLPEGAEVADGHIVWARSGDRGDAELEFRLRPRS